MHEIDKYMEAYVKDFNDFGFPLSIEMSREIIC